MVQHFPKTITTMMRLWTALVVLSLGLAQALDVEVVKTTCDESLPVTADLYLKCSEGSRCTFGESATVFGTSKLLYR